MRKIVLLIISLNLTACGQYNWPVNPPIVNDCQVNWTNEHPNGGFFCESTEEDPKERKKEFREFKDARMKGAHALPADDYKKSQGWLGDIKTWIRNMCK